VKGSLHTALWCVVAPIALAGFLYQNDGWVQFGYRFSNDFSFALMMLLAIGGRPMTRTWKVLIVVGIIVNLFGAVTFGRFSQFDYDGFFPISPNEY
jgi:drug/metabolite transporter (DMT)-like permease